MGVGLRGLEACGQSVDMAGEGGGRREGVGPCGEVGRSTDLQLLVQGYSPHDKSEVHTHLAVCPHSQV